jgi:hypothetical protein
MMKTPKQEAPAQWLTPGLLGFGKTGWLLPMPAINPTQNYVALL